MIPLTMLLTRDVDGPAYRARCREDLRDEAPVLSRVSSPVRAAELLARSLELRMAAALSALGDGRLDELGARLHERERQAAGRPAWTSTWLRRLVEDEAWFRTRGAYLARRQGQVWRSGVRWPALVHEAERLEQEASALVAEGARSQGTDE